MSSELSDRERHILDHAKNRDQPDEDGPSRKELMDMIETLQAEVCQLRDQQDKDEQFKQDTARRLAQIESEMNGDAAPVGGTLLEKYASMPEDVRQDTLSASEYRATVIKINWDDLAWKAQNGSYLVDTAKTANVRHQPAQFKRDLENLLGRSIQSNVLHRVMKATARLSAPDRDEINETRDGAGRLHITGGSFEYHDRTTPDNTDDTTKKVLEEVVE